MKKRLNSNYFHFPRVIFEDKVSDMENKKNNFFQFLAVFFLPY